ncbi:MAG: alkaline phosphatase family protein [Desulfobacterales bacterium]|nr:alkaline phosphatase family protein [Desulfobacterales bacterium]
MKPVDSIASVYRRLRRKMSRAEWSVRLLGLSRCIDTKNEPGLIMIQIDGLSLTQFKRALTRGRLPFIRKLILNRGFVIHSFYSGVPSSTPAVQGELFYGVKTSVPAFEFIDRRAKEHHAMFYPASANHVTARLKRAGNPLLLKGGSAYSHIYSGGADTARYCSETMNLQSLADAINPLKLVSIFLFHVLKLFRVLGFACIELILALYDFFGGVFQGENVFKELKFIPTRLFICVILREMIRFRVKMDVTCGVPIVSANFLGYDEQAHRRGPQSAFAHWTLKGIDEVVKDIFKTAALSDKRNYQLVVYSDHGQESVQNFQDLFGKSLKQAVNEHINQFYGGTGHGSSEHEENILEQGYRQAANLLFDNALWIKKKELSSPNCFSDRVEITTMGPIGHVYLPKSGNYGKDGNSHPAGLTRLAFLLNRKAKIPLVLFRQDDKVIAVNDTGAYDLKKNGEYIVGSNHPFLDQVVEDLTRCCLHPDAGDLVLSGWKAEGTPISFNIESGSHGGPGREETRGFALLPPEMIIDKPFIRPMDLRDQIFIYRGKKLTGKGKTLV